MLRPLYNSMNQQLFEKKRCNQISHHENYGQFLLQMEATKLTIFVVSKDEWDTNDSTNKSIKKCIIIVVWQKAPLGLKQC